MAPDLERLFARYRLSGDPEALGRVFDRTAPALFRVALHLTRNRAEAEDLLQETFLAAMAKAGDYDPERPLVPWLLGFLRIGAFRLRRTEGRWPAPERMERPPIAPPEQEAATRELDAAVAAAIAELPHPYREVLELHLREDLAPVQVARTLGRPPATVRTQLKRGLALLRSHLPRSFLPALALFPTEALQRIRAEICARPAGAALAGASVPIALIGGCVMKRIVAAVLLVGLLATGGLVLGPLFQEPACMAPDIGPELAAGAAAKPLMQESSQKAQAPASRQAMPPADAEMLLVQVEDGEGRPLPGARVRIGPGGEDPETAAAWLGNLGDGVTGPEGRAAFEMPRKRATPLLWLRVERKGYAARDFETRERRCTVRLTRESRLEGKILCFETGEPLANVLVALQPDRNPRSTPWRREVRSGPDGAFDFRGLSPGGHDLNAFPPLHVACRLQLYLREEENRTIELRVPRGVSLEGRVLKAEDRRPVGEGRIVVDEISFGVGRKEACLDAEGRFRLEGLRTGTTRHFYVIAAGRHFGKTTLETGPDYDPTTGTQIRQAVILAAPAPSLSGRVVAANGAKVAGAEIHPGASGRAIIQLAVPFWRIFGSKLGLPGSPPILTDAEGRFHLPAVTFPIQEILVLHPDHPAHLEILPSPWECGEILIRLPDPIAIQLLIEDGQGRPLPGAGVKAGFLGPAPPGRIPAPLFRRAPMAADARGRLELRLGPGFWLLAGRSPEGKAAGTMVLEAQSAGQAPARLTLKRGHFVRGTLQDPAGRPLAGVEVAITMTGERLAVITSQEGCFAFEGLCPSPNQRLQVSLSGLPGECILGLEARSKEVLIDQDNSVVVHPLPLAHLGTRRVLDARTGKAIPWGSLHLQTKDSGNILPSSSFYGGLVELSLPDTPGVRVIFSADGYAKKEYSLQELSAEGTPIELEPVQRKP